MKIQPTTYTINDAFTDVRNAMVATLGLTLGEEYEAADVQRIAESPSVVNHPILLEWERTFAGISGSHAAADSFALAMANLGEIGLMLSDFGDAIGPVVRNLMTLAFIAGQRYRDYNPPAEEVVN